MLIGIFKLLILGICDYFSLSKEMYESVWISLLTWDSLSWRACVVWVWLSTCLACSQLRQMSMEGYGRFFPLRSSGEGWLPNSPKVGEVALCLFAFFLCWWTHLPCCCYYAVILQWSGPSVFQHGLKRNPSCLCPEFGTAGHVDWAVLSAVCRVHWTP